MKREQILEAAKNIVCCGDREGLYGRAEDSFNSIAAFWSVYLERRLSAKDVAVMMALLKVARIKEGKYKSDNWIDIIGYCACGGEIEERDERRKVNDRSNEN